MIHKAAYDAKYVKRLKKRLYKLLITLAQVKAGNTSENLLNEIYQIIYFLYQAKEITWWR